MAWRRRLVDVWPFLAVLPVAAGFYFFVDIRDHQDVYVGWRVGHLTSMALIPFMGLAWTGMTGLGGARRVAGATALGVTMLLALPTVAIDFFNTQDIVPNDLGPAWRRTQVITPHEMEGLQWLRAHTDARAVVQVDTLARGDEMWAFIPAFADDAPDPQVAFALAERFGIDYLVVGPPERAAHPGVETRWATDPDELPMAFHNAALSIYQVRHQRP